MKTKVLILALVLVLSLVVVGLALANGSVERTREVLGGAAAGGGYKVYLPLVLR